MPIPPHVAPRLKIDRAKAKADLVRQDPTLNATDAEVDAALSTLNQDALYDEARVVWTEAIWDRTSPINGVPAEHFLNRDDVDSEGDGDIYLLLRNGVVVGFQPHEPEQEGLVPIPKGQGLTRAKTQADNIAAAETASEVVRRVRENILSKRAGV